MKNVQIQHNIGKAKYCVSYWDGIKTHLDGSEFHDTRIFKSKKRMNTFLKELQTLEEQSYH